MHTCRYVNYAVKSGRPDSLDSVPDYIFCAWLLHGTLRKAWVSIHTHTHTISVTNIYIGHYLCSDHTGPTGFKCEHAWAMKMCATSHTRDKLIYGFSFRQRKKETGNTQQHHKGQRWLPTALLWAAGKPAMAQNPPVSGNPACFALSRASSRGHEQIPGNMENVCSLWVLEKFWKSEGGEGRKEARANKESLEDKYARTLAFQLPFPGLMNRVTLWPQPHTNQNQTLYPMVTNSIATVPYAPATRTRTPKASAPRGHQHRQGLVNEELSGPFTVVSLFMVSVSCGQNIT